MEPERINRLKREIDQFLETFNSDNNDQILLLMFYHGCLHGYQQQIQETFKEQIQKIDDVVSALPKEKMIECAKSFDFNTYIDSFLDLYGNWLKRKIADQQMVDAAVKLMIVIDGYRFVLANPVCSGLGRFWEEWEKKYRLLHHSTWSLMHDEFSFRYEEEYKDTDEYEF